MRSQSLRVLAGSWVAAVAIFAVGQAAAQQPTPPAPEQPRPTLKIFNLSNARAAPMSDLLGELIPNARIAVDDRTNSLIISGDDEALRIAEALALKLDATATQQAQPESTSSPRRSVNIRLLWLASGLKEPAGALPKDLEPVISELSKAGIHDLQLVANTMLSSRGESFNLLSTPSLETPVTLAVEGTLKWSAENSMPLLTVQLVVQRVVERSKPSGETLGALLNLSSTIDAPFGQFIVLGAAPIGKMESVFVLQVTPK
jgi:hypothetical protein